jgi:DNA-binding SARP family transcriptional activator
MKLEFRLLGDVAVLTDGHPLDLGGTRPRGVLGLLLLQRNRPIATELLVERLWPEDQPLTATKAIQVYVWRLRRALGPAADRLMSSPTGYALAVADDELDAARFERGLRQAREMLASGSPDAARVTLEEALALWSGPALGDLAAEQFARREADRLEELRLQAFEELFALRIGAGMARETIGELRRLTGEQPGRERLWRLLMLALYADGRQGEALTAYQDARRYLVDELGLDPGPELQDLERAILTQEAPRPRQATLVSVGSPDEAIESRTRHDTDAPDAVPMDHRTRRIVTVLRADLDQAPDAGGLDPEVLGTVQRQALEVVHRAVERHGGIIDRADEDGVTALFGLTVTREDDALRAVRAATELKGDSSWADTTDALSFRIGVVTGEVVTGQRDVHGSAITGAPLQVAAHLAARAAPSEVLLASETAQLVRAATSTESLSFESGDDAPVSTAVRLIALAEGEAIARQMTTPFIDREVEMQALLTAFERVVTDGAPGLATVIGAPGVGKSRLVAESLARISKRARILRSRCLPYGEGITYWPIRELVLAGAGIGHGEAREDALAKLETIVAGLDRAELVRRRVATVVGLADDDAPAEEIQWAVRRFFEALASEGPLVLLVDDLQWAEPALVDLLGHLLDLGRGPLLLITIARPELEEAQPDWLARTSHALVRLDSLSESDAEKLLDHLAPELPPGPLHTRILAAAEGNPLFVEQFVAYVSDEAHAVGQRLDDRTRADLPIPPTIEILLAARLDRLPAGERRILERAAVIGRTFWAGALAELLPPDERADLPRHLAHLAHRDLIRPDRSVFPDDEAFRFRHLLIRDAAYASLPKSGRADLHERFAGWLERRSEASRREYDLILGYHLEQAYRYRIELGDGRADARSLADRALQYITPAGQAAWERGDPNAAASLLRRAADLCLPGPQRIGLLLDLRNALREVGDREAADAVDAEVVALLAECPDRGSELRRRLLDARFAVDASIEEIRDAYAYYDQAGDRPGMILALDVAHFTHYSRGEFTAAMKALEQATALALEIGHRGLAAELVAAAAVRLWDSPVPVPEALDRCRRCLDLAGDNRLFRAAILCVIGLLEAMDGADDGWRRHFDEAKAIMDDLGLPLGVSSYALWLGDAELAAGEPGRAVELLRWSCSTLGRLVGLGEPPSQSRWSGLLASLAPLTAQTLLAVGQLEEVERYAFWGRDIANPADLDAQLRWRIAISGLRSRQGRHDEAVALAREAVALLAGSEFMVLLAEANEALASALRAAGDEPAAVVAAQDARRLASAKQDRSALRKIEAFLSG